jgi:hypothetical protein
MSPKWLSGRPQGSPKAKIDLMTQKVQFNLGEQVKGTVRIVSEEEFDVTQAIVWLTCNENIKKTQHSGANLLGIPIPLGGTTQSEYWANAVIYSTSYVLFEAARIPKGYDATLPYTLSTSSAAKETLYSIDHYVRWVLYAVLEVRGRPNVQTITYEIQVSRPQVSPSSPTIMKEVTREVVLVPCAYCGGLMPQTSLFCPNCGARRKT